MEPTNYTLWLAVSAVLTNVFVWLFLKYCTGLSDIWKRAVTAIVALIVSTVGLFYQGMLDTTDWARTWMVVFMAATTAYVVIWKPLADSAKGPPTEGIA